MSEQVQTCLCIAKSPFISSVAQLLHCLKYASARLSLVIINVFQMTGLLRCTYYLNKQETKYVSIYLNKDNLKPQVKIETSGHAVLK